MSEGEKRAYYPQLDWARLFLALEVWWLHVPITHRGVALAVLPINPVPAFVAISGYLVYQSLKRTETTSQFWIGRALRVLPAFFVSLGLTYAVAGEGAFQDSLFSYFSMHPVIRFQGANFALWSLLIEEILYFALVIFFEAGFFAKPTLNRALVWLCAVAMSIFAILRIFDPQDVEPAYFAITFAFFLGTFMVGSKFVEPITKFWPAFAIACIVGAASYYQIHDRIAHSLIFIVMNVCGPVAALGFGLSKPILPKLPIDISYGVYVYHLLSIFITSSFGLQGLTFMLVSLGMTLALATISSLVIERPLLKLKKRWIPTA